MLVERRHRGFEHVLSRERVVLEIVRAAAVQLVRAGLGDHLDLRAAVAAIHGGEVVGHDAHFLHRFGVRRQVGDPPARDAVGARVVDGERVGLVALTAGVDARRRFAGEGIVPGAPRAERRGNPPARDAGLQRDEIVEIPSVQRHLLQLDAIHAPRHAALLGFHQWSRPCHRHGFADVRELQCEIEPRRFADADIDGVPLDLAEP